MSQDFKEWKFRKHIPTLGCTIVCPSPVVVGSASRMGGFPNAGQSRWMGVSSHTEPVTSLNSFHSDQG